MLAGGTDDGKIAKITHPASPRSPSPTTRPGRFSNTNRTHSATFGGATLTSTVVYGASIAATTSGDDTHPDLSATRVAAWGQTSVPLAAAVVYGPGDHRPQGRHRLRLGRRRAGHQHRRLLRHRPGRVAHRHHRLRHQRQPRPHPSVANRDRALNPTHYTEELASLGLGGATPTAIADALSARTLYAANGIDATHLHAPAHRFVLPDGVTTAVGRSHDHTDYGTTNYPTVSPADWTTGAPRTSPPAPPRPRP